jgi:uncharacterized membrane protein YccC
MIGYAIRNAIGIGAPLAIAVMLGAPTVGIALASGGLIVGFADVGETPRTRVGAMALATVVGGVSAALGALAAESWPFAIAAAAIWGVGTGLCVEAGPVPARVALLATMGLVLFGSYPESVGQAAQIGVLVVAGGMLQALLAISIPTTPPELAPPPSWREARLALVAALAARGQAFRHAVRLSLALGAAALVERVLIIDRSYWVSLAVLFVMKPGAGETAIRGIQRFLGTVGGVVLVTLAVAVLEPDPLVIAIGVGVAVFPAYAYFQASYLIFAVAWTVVTVLLVAVLGPPEAAVALERLIDNCIGLVLVGLAVMAVPEPHGGRTTP